MPCFDLFVIGSGGGPDESNLSGYLLKDHDMSWQDGIIGLEAGSGLGTLQHIIKPNLFPSARPGGTAVLDAIEVYSCIRTYLITHAHLDHICSLVLTAGTLQGAPRRNIRGSTRCLEDLESVFGPGRIWPNLASWDVSSPDYMYLLDPIPEGEKYHVLSSTLSVHMLPISHGPNYESAAFFIRHDPSMREFLFLGDVEPDSLANYPRTKAVWQAAAPKIPHILDTIFIECSWPSGRRDEQLYGHLTPEHLIAELEVLSAAVSEHKSNQKKAGEYANDTVHSRTKRRRIGEIEHSPVFSDPDQAARTLDSSSSGTMLAPLSGLTVYITHCKDSVGDELPGQPMYDVITDQVRQLAMQKNLGIAVHAAVQGAMIRI